MQLKEIISTAAHSGNLVGNGRSDSVRPDEVPQVGGGFADTARSGSIEGTVESEKYAYKESRKVDEIIEEMREFHGWGNFNIDFDLDDATNSMVVKIIDRDTGETLRQIPPDQVLKIKQHMRETLGLIFDHLA